MANQKEIRENVELGPGMAQVSTAGWWWKHGLFENEEQARGALRLAQQQGLDGMGKSVWEWMGLSTEEYSRWLMGELPPSQFTPSVKALSIRERQ